MSIVTAETLLPFRLQEPPATEAEALSDRRGDIDGKHSRLALLLREVGCDGLLLLEPENFAWLTSGAAARGALDPAEQPALYLSADQRWAIAGNADSQRLFDEELNGLGFQLKEWPWHWGREQLLLDLCRGRNVASDQPLNGAKLVTEAVRRLRREVTAYERACYKALGTILSHALEATCRHLQPGETEREIAGQLSHRLLHRGTVPLAISVAVDGRSRVYRQGGYTNTPLRHYAVLTVAARKYGLCATSSRSVSFGTTDPQFRQEYDAACKVSATYLASSWPDAMPAQILNTAKRVYLLTGYEHEWRLCPQGHVTGRAPVELTLLPQTQDLFQAGWAVTWRASVGAAAVVDTVLITAAGPQLVTAAELWPLKRIRVQGAEFLRPDLLLR